MIYGLLSVFLLSVAFSFGFGVAHHEVGKECERLGAFYVGDKTYQCKLKEKP